MMDKHIDDAMDAPPAADPSEPARRDESSADGATDAAGPGAAGAIDVLTRERDEYYDRLLRKTAEFENYRRRVERERREQADQSVVDLMLDLLLVVDDFERALEAEAGEGATAYRKGVELIHTKLHDLLAKRGVKAIAALGTDFDPNLHQAVVHESSPGRRDGEVIGELRRGYTIGDRLLRPAMVKVAKG